MSKVNKAEAKVRAQKLRTQLSEYDYNYYVLDEPIVTDAVWDGLEQELKSIESLYPDLITPDSPTQRVVGQISKGFRSVPHKIRMISLNDVFDEAEVEAWARRITKLLPTGTEFSFFGDVKKDGLAASLIYQDGVFSQALTRGDGFVGEDVTTNVRTIKNVPLRLRKNNVTKILLMGRTEVRGEIVMFKEDFEDLNKQRKAAGQPLFANPRNTAAGTIRQLDPKLVAARPLQFLAYDILRDEPADIPSNHFAYTVLKELGFSGGEYSTKLPDIIAIHDYAVEWDTKRQDLSYNIDGLVIKVDDRQLYAKLGVVGKTPRGAIAYKYPAEQSTTKIKDIFISIGRTGAATPVAILDPVFIAGSTVQMATLHNEGEVRRKDIRVGDTVVVHKAGDIIPEVVEPLVKLRTGNEIPFEMPENCPDCNTKLVKFKKDEAIWRCPNISCPSRLHNHIRHYASKGALDIDGLGEKNVLALLGAGLIADAADLYKLTEEQLLQLDRFAEVSAKKLIASISDKKQPLLAKFLFGLGIRHVGTQTAIDLANHFYTLKNLQSASTEALAAVDGVGEVVGESLVAWFADPLNQKLLDKFSQHGVEPVPVRQTGGPLIGKNFVVTGSLDTMSRDEAADKIRTLGGTFQSSVGKETDYLVVGGNVGAGKLAKADKLGTKQISELDLLKILSN